MVDMDHGLQIGELAERCETTTRTLRYYEDLGLIGPLRRGTGKFRIYGSETEGRIKQIKELQDLLGWSLDEIRLHFQLDDEVKRLRDAFSRAQSTTERLEILAEARAFTERQRVMIAERQARLLAMDLHLQQKILRYRELEGQLQSRADGFEKGHE